MSPYTTKIVKDFATIFAIVNPIATMAIFAGITAGCTSAERRSIALRSSIYATVILVIAVIAGQIILDAVGVRMQSLKVAGGIILFLFGVRILFGTDDGNHNGSAEAGRDLAVFPLAVPAIAGPGALMAIIVLTDNDVYTVPEQIETAVVLLVVLALNYVLMLMSEYVLRVIGRQGAAILVRVMGILLAAIAVEIVLTALGIPNWAMSIPRQ